MDFTRNTAATLLLLAAVAGSAAAAAQETDTRAVGVEQQKLVDFRARLTTLEREQQTLERTIADKQKQLEALRKQPAPEQGELNAARQEVEEARAAFKNSPGPDSEARLKNAEFKWTLAERKLNKGNPEMSALSEELERLQTQHGNRQGQITALRQQIETQASRTAQLQQKLEDERNKREQQAKELARTRQEADQAQREIERLKALLASKESEQKQAVAPPAAAARPVAAAAAPAQAAQPATVQTSKPAPATKPASGTTAAQSASGTGPRQLASQAEVLDALRGLEQRLTGREDRSKGVNEILHLKRLQNGKEVDRTRVTLQFLGAQQYRGSDKVPPGDYEMVLGLHRWPVRLEGSQSGDTVFLLDYSDTNKPQLQFYKLSLEGG